MGNDRRMRTLLLLALVVLLSRAALAAPVTIPTEPYGPQKTAVWASIGGGRPVMAEIDTGSDVLVVERSYAGPGVRMTSQRLTLTYGHGTNPRPGVVGMGRCSLLDHGTPRLTTTVDVPVLVVPDGVVNRSAKGNHAILGLGMRSGVTPRLFFPPPCDRMMLIDRPAGTLSFGAWTADELTGFAMIRLPASAAWNHSLPAPTTTARFWDDRRIPVTCQVAGLPPRVLPTLFDSGARTTLRLPSLRGVRHQGRRLLAPARAAVETSQGALDVPLTTPTFVSQDAPGANAGNAIFMRYRVLYDQENGRIGLLRAASPRPSPTARPTGAGGPLPR